jgi:antirestriction protein ArdC
VIRIPAPTTFHSPEDYYHTLYHEMTHATGHASRLDREGITQHAKFGSDRYSKEELVAELGAAFLSNETEILDGVRFENSAAYLARGFKARKRSPRDRLRGLAGTEIAISSWESSTGIASGMPDCRGAAYPSWSMGLIPGFPAA